MFKTRLILAIIFTQAILLLAVPMTSYAPAEYDIEAEANPEEAGEVSGEGTFEEGEEVTLEARPAEGYKFTSWKEDGEKVSSSGEYNFKVESDKSLVAVFDEIDFGIKEGKDGEAFKKKAEVPINIVQGTPEGRYILSQIAVGLNSPIYAIFDFEKWDHDDEKFLENAQEYLPFPGNVDISTYIPQVSPDGNKLAYYSEKFSGYDLSGGAVYVINFGLPLDVKHVMPLEKDELVRGAPSGIAPGWNPGSEGIYYITAEGLMYYCFEEQEPTKIVPASELKGLIQKNDEIPSVVLHAFYLDNYVLQLAYVDSDENSINILFIEDEVEKDVIEVETEIKEIWHNKLDFLLDGQYLALRQGLIIETQAGEEVEFATEGDIIAYDCNREDRLVVLLGKKYGEGYKLKFKLLNSDLEVIETLFTLAPEPEHSIYDWVEITSHNDKWLFSIDGEVYSFDFNGK